MRAIVGSRPLRYLLAIPVLFALYFYGAQNMGLLGPDEPRYAAIGREMAQTNDWVTPRLWGEGWFEKPALLYWMIGLAYRCGFGDDLAPRVPVALIATVFLFFYFYRLRSEFGEQPALYSTLILGTSAGFLAFGQIAVTDLPLTATFSAAMLLCLPWIRSGGRRGLILGGITLGLAVLAKGVVPLVLALPLLWVSRRRWRDLAFFTLACLAVAVPWYVLCYQRNGSAFVDEFFWRHHFARFTSDLLRHNQPVWFYLPVFAGFLFPWTPALVLIPAHLRSPDPRRQFLLLLAGWGMLFFSLSNNKLPGYILPLFPPVCALIGLSLAEKKNARLVVPLCAVLVALVPMAAATLPQALVSGLRDAPVAPLPWWGIALGFGLGSFCYFLEGRQVRSYGILTVALAMAVTVVLAKATTYPALDRIASVRPVWLSVASRRDEVCVADLNRTWRFGLNFYSRTPLPDCKGNGLPIRLIPAEDGPPIQSFQPPR